MKNKKFTYFLGFLVLAVWGIIIYRIFASVSADDDNPLPVINKANREAFDDYSIPADTTHLSLKYKDPFGLIKQKDTVKSTTKKNPIVNAVPPISKPVFSWGFIKYSGYIRNPGSKNLIAVVNINGKSAIMAEGETVEQVKLVKNFQDSIKVTFQGKTTFIKM